MQHNICGAEGVEIWGWSAIWLDAQGGVFSEGTVVLRCVKVRKILRSVAMCKIVGGLCNFHHRPAF